MEGRRLDKNETLQEKAKVPYQNFLKLLISGLIAMYFVIKWAVRNAIIEAEEELSKRKYGKELPESEDEEETE